MSNQSIQDAKRAIRKAELALQTAKDNLAFAKLPKAQKRVAIARDVIAQVKLGMIDVQQGKYLGDVVKVEDDNGNVVGVEKCTACALGSLFACAVNKPALKLDLDDALPAYGYSGADDDSMREQLGDVFSEDQLRLIESAFEMDDFLEGDDSKYQDVIEDDGTWTGETVFKGRLKKAVDFGERYTSDKRRLIAIMENVIENNGTFRP